MTDVRLTATTTDGEVVPVLSNTKGELLLEAPIAPPEFDGNLDGDLNVTGSGTFAGNVFINNASGDQQVFIGNDGSFGAAWGQISSGLATYISGGDGKHYIGFNGDANSGTIKLDPADGSASFAGGLATIDKWGQIKVNTPSSSGYAFQSRILDGNATCIISGDGSAQFAGNKAGITAEGYFWCTTRRGDTVILDATSNGLASWADYSPPTRRDVLTEKLDQLKRGDGSDNSQ